MKKIFFLLVCVLCAFSSCSKDDVFDSVELKTNIDKSKTCVTAKVKFYGDYSVSVSTLSLTRAATTSNDLYGVQIFTKNGETLTPYAHGLFDDPSLIKADFVKSDKYAIYCRYIKNGKNTLRKYSVNDNTYSEPFSLSPWTSGLSGVSKIDNTIVYSVDQYLKTLYKHQGIAFCDDGVYYGRPDIESYDGEIIEYSPNDSTTFGIDLKKVYFGLKIKIENLTEGSVTTTLDDMRSVTINSTDSVKTFSDIFTFKGGSVNWRNDNYSETVAIKIVFKNGNGIETILAEQNVVFYRNKETTIKVAITEGESSTSRSASVKTENGEMTKSDTNYEF